MARRLDTGGRERGAEKKRRSSEWMIPRLREDEACYILTFVAIPTSYHYSDLPTCLPTLRLNLGTTWSTVACCALQWTVTSPRAKPQATPMSLSVQIQADRCPLQESRDEGRGNANVGGTRRCCVPQERRAEGSRRFKRIRMPCPREQSWERGSQQVSLHLAAVEAGTTRSSRLWRLFHWGGVAIDFGGEGLASMFPQFQWQPWQANASQ